MPVLDQTGANEVRDGLRPVGVTLFADHLVQVLQQGGRKRNGEPGNELFLHDNSFFTSQPT